MDASNLLNGTQNDEEKLPAELRLVRSISNPDASDAEQPDTLDAAISDAEDAADASDAMDPEDATDAPDAADAADDVETEEKGAAGDDEESSSDSSSSSSSEESGEDKQDIEDTDTMYDPAKEKEARISIITPQDVADAEDAEVDPNDNNNDDNDGPTPQSDALGTVSGMSALVGMSRTSPMQPNDDYDENPGITGIIITPAGADTDPNDGDDDDTVAPEAQNEENEEEVDLNDENATSMANNGNEDELEVSGPDDEMDANDENDEKDEIDQDDGKNGDHMGSGDVVLNATGGDNLAFTSLLGSVMPSAPPEEIAPASSADEAESLDDGYDEAPDNADDADDADAEDVAAAAVDADDANDAEIAEIAGMADMTDDAVEIMPPAGDGIITAGGPDDLAPTVSEDAAAETSDAADEMDGMEDTAAVTADTALGDELQAEDANDTTDAADADGAADGEDAAETTGDLVDVVVDGEDKVETSKPDMEVNVVFNDVAAASDDPDAREEKETVEEEDVADTTDGAGSESNTGNEDTDAKRDELDPMQGMEQMGQLDQMDSGDVTDRAETADSTSDSKSGATGDNDVHAVHADAVGIAGAGGNSHDPMLSGSNLTVVGSGGSGNISGSEKDADQSVNESKNSSSDTAGSNASDSGTGGTGPMLDKIAGELDSGLRSAQRLGMFLVSFLSLCVFAGAYACGFYFGKAYVYTWKFALAYGYFVLNALALLVIVFYAGIVEAHRPVKNSAGRIARRRVDGCCNKLFAVGVVRELRGVIAPFLVHFADMAGTVACVVEFYEKSRNDRDGDFVDYNVLLWAMVGLVGASRIGASLIVANYSKSLKNTVLELFGLYVFKLAAITVDFGDVKVSLLQAYALYLEAFFKSAPQLVICLYVTLGTWAFSDKSLSLAVIICGGISLFNILLRSIWEDSFVVQNPRFASLNCHRWFRFNILYVVRLFWRVCDICGWVLLLVLLSLVTSVSTLVLFLALCVLCAIIYPVLRVCLDHNITLILDDILLFNVLLQTPVPHARSRNGPVAIMYGLFRIAVHVALLFAVYYFDRVRDIPVDLIVFDEVKKSGEHEELALLYYIALGLFGASLCLYVLHFVSEFNIFFRACCGRTCCKTCCCKCACSDACCRCCDKFDRCNMNNCSMLRADAMKPVETEEEVKNMKKEIERELHVQADSVVGCGMTGMMPRSLVSCKNMDDVLRLVKFEYAVSMSDVLNVETWVKFDDPLALLKFVLDSGNRAHVSKKWDAKIKERNFGDFEAFGSVWFGILANAELSRKGIEYVMELLATGNFEEFGESKRARRRCNLIMKVVIRHQSDPEIATLLVEKFNARSTEKLVRYAMKYNKSPNKEAIVKYLQSGVKSVEV